MPWKNFVAHLNGSRGSLKWIARLTNVPRPVVEKHPHLTTIFWPYQRIGKYRYIRNSRMIEIVLIQMLLASVMILMQVLEKWRNLLQLSFHRRFEDIFHEYADTCKTNGNNCYSTCSPFLYSMSLKRNVLKKWIMILFSVLGKIQVYEINSWFFLHQYPFIPRIFFVKTWNLWHCVLSL